MIARKLVNTSSSAHRRTRIFNCFQQATVRIISYLQDDGWVLILPDVSPEILKKAIALLDCGTMSRYLLQSYCLNVTDLMRILRHHVYSYDAAMRLPDHVRPEEINSEKMSHFHWYGEFASIDMESSCWCCSNCEPHASRQFLLETSVVMKYLLLRYRSISVSEILQRNFSISDKQSPAKALRMTSNFFITSAIAFHGTKSN